MIERFRRRSAVMFLVSITMIFLACTRSVSIRPHDISALSGESGSFVITTKQGERFAARALSLSDSTLTIQSLRRSDPRYQTVELPIQLDLREIDSITRVQVRLGPTVLWLGAGVLVIALVIYIGTYEASSLD